MHEEPEAARATMQTVPFLAYTAGFFDADGSVGIYWHNHKERRHGGHYSLVATITQAQCLPKLLEWRGRWGGSLNYVNGIADERSGWRWTIGGDAGQKFLEEILPYLGNKRDQAEFGIEFQRRRVRGSPVTDEELAWQEAMAEAISGLKEIAEPAPEDLLAQIRRSVAELSGQLELWPEMEGGGDD